jgi:putative ABC transport system permease protein
MIGLALRGLATRKLRSSLTAIAVLLGVAMIAGTYVLTDQIQGGFDDLQENVYAGVDAELTRKEAFDTQFGSVRPLPQSLVDRVRQVDGVAAAEGQVEETGGLVIDGKLEEASGPGLIVTTSTPEPFNSAANVEGDLPTRPGQVAVLRDTADKHDLKIGDRIGIATRTGTPQVTVSAIFDLGDVSSLGGTDVVMAPLADIQRWFNREGEVTSVVAAADDGVPPEQLVQRIRAAVPDRDIEVKTGSESARDTADEINDEIGGFLTPALLTFAGAALLVGAFIIFNTFSITVAERTREFAMLRTIGATRRQILLTVATEALVIGIVASALGLLTGIGFARLLNALFESVGFGLPTAGVSIATRTIVVSLIVGVVVTLIAALSPALRATRVAPVAALRSAGEGLPARRRRFAPYIAGAVVVIGVLLLLVGLFGSGPAEGRLLSMAGGVVFLFIGVALTARYFVRPLAGAVGWPVQKLFGQPGLLARENAMRNPGRTATTAAALMVGLGLVVFVAVFAQSLKASFTDSIDRLISSEIIITERNFNPLPEGLVADVRETPGVGVAAAIRFDDIRVGNKTTGGFGDVMNGVDPRAMARVYDADWLGDGTNALWSQLSNDTAVIEEQFAKTHDLKEGDTFRIRGTSGGSANLRVLGIYKDPVLMTGFAVSEQVYGRLSAERDPVIVLADVDQGADAGQVQDAIAQRLEQYPSARVESNAEYLETFEDQLNQLVSLLYALLAMSLVISVFGIANSLFLTIHERTRELGLLRAVGGTRRQVRLMVVNESVITAVIGGLLGAAIGVLFGFLVSQALDDLGLGFSLPAGQIVFFLVMAAVVGVIGAIAPARRSSRLNVLEALRVE